MLGDGDLPSGRGVFISHITNESRIALVVKKYLKQAYPDLPVFVSSDNLSIPGGEEWWTHIRDSIKKSAVVLVFMSDESVTQPWINFEAGVGDGSDRRVIPVAVKGYTFDKLDFPLKGFQGRYVDDLEGILHDIDTATRMGSGSFEKGDYLKELRTAEESVTYKSLVLRPFLNGNDLNFEVENTGNVDVDLLYAEIRIPYRVLEPNWSPLWPAPTFYSETVGDDRVFEYWNLSSPKPTHYRPLIPTITRSMGPRRLGLHFTLKQDFERTAVIGYQIHARNCDTQPEEKILKEILPS